MLTDPETNKRATLHDLRRTFSGHLDEAGLTRQEKQRTMRHKDFRATDEHYARKAPERIAAKLRERPGAALDVRFASPWPAIERLPVGRGALLL